MKRGLPWLSAVLLLGLAAWVEPLVRVPLAFALLLVCPGYLLAELSHDTRPLAAQLASWPLAGAALTGALYLWAGTARVALAPSVLVLLSAALALATVVVALRPRRSLPESSRPAVPRSPAPGAGAAVSGPITRDPALVPALTALGLVAGLVGWARVVQAEGLYVPLWVDSLHHTLLVRVAFERGAPPIDLTPYLPVDQLLYHWGYHVVLATALHTAGGAVPADLPGALLAAGQIVGFLVPLAWGAVAWQLTRRPLAAPVAALVAGLVSIMPAFYLSWGRYTLLFGMLLLPGVLLALGDALRTGGWRTLLRAVVALVALTLTHIAVTLLAILWVVALLLLAAAPARALRRALLVALAATVLCAPWLGQLFGRAQWRSGPTAAAVVGDPGFNALAEGLLWTSPNLPLVALAALAALLGLRRRRRTVVLLVLWCAGIMLLANPPLIGLPYLSLFTNETVAITMFAPLALLIAAGVADLLRGARAQWVAAFVIVALAIWGAGQQRSVVRADTRLADAADLRAIAWVRDNLPADARFVVRSTPWLATVDRGLDGGWWLLPLAGRGVSTPPVIYNNGGAAYRARVVAESSFARSDAANDPAQIAAFMRAAGYTHVYTRAGATPLDPARLGASPRFAAVYAADGVTIFALRGP